MTLIVKKAIPSETQQFREYIDRLTRTLRELSSNPNNFKNEKDAIVTREQIKKLKSNIADILIGNIDSMSLDQVSMLRDLVINDEEVGITLTDLDVKVTNSKNIKNEVLRQYDEAPKLFDKMDLYRKYLSFTDGSFAVFILSKILVDYENDRVLNTNQQCIDFLVRCIADLKSLGGSWEINTIRDELIDKILRRETVEHYIATSAIADINAAKDNIEMIRIFAEKVSWKNSYVVDVLEPIFRKCGTKDEDNELICDFIVTAFYNLESNDRLLKKDQEKIGLWKNRFKKVSKIAKMLSSESPK